MRRRQNFKTLGGIPVSVYASIDLPHALEVFGKDFRVHISTHFTFNPDTVFRAAVGVSLDAGMRKFAPAQHQLLRTVARVEAGKHNASETTKRLIAKHLKGVVSAEQMRRTLHGAGPPPEPRSDWDTVLQGLQDGKDDFLQSLCRLLSACDAHALYVRALTMRGQSKQAVAYVEELFRPDIEAWVRLMPSLPPNLYVPVEVALKVIAWVECRGAHPQAGRHPDTSHVDCLLLPGRRPMGHWLDEVRAASGCRNLRQLETRVPPQAMHHGRTISYDLLRRWSSCKKVLVPAAAMRSLVAAVREKNSVDTLSNRFYMARFLTFLCDLLRAATLAERPAWEHVQAHVRSRHAQVYRLQILHSSATRDVRSAATT